MPPPVHGSSIFAKTQVLTYQRAKMGKRGVERDGAEIVRFGRADLGKIENFA